MFNFLAKKMMEKQMAGVPKEQQEKLFSAIEKDPKFFEELAKEIQEKVKGGMGKQEAAIEVMMANQDKLAKMLQE